MRFEGAVRTDVTRDVAVARVVSAGFVYRAFDEKVKNAMTSPKV